MPGDIYPIINSGNAGVLSRDMDGQTDHEKYYKGLRVGENFICKPHGSLYRRPGSRFVSEVKDSSQAVRIIDFSFSKDHTQSYVLELGNLYIRFHTKGGTVMDEGVPYEIATPWTIEQVWELDYVQTADEVRLTHGNVRGQVLIRHAHADWTIDPMDFRIQGHDLQIPDPNPLGATGKNGTTFTLPDTRVFEEKYIIKGRNADGDVRWFHYLGDGFFKAEDGDRTITFKDVKDVDGKEVEMNYDAGEIEAIYNADGDLNPDWDVLTSDESKPEEWDGTNWPGKIGLFEERQILARTPDRPLTYWGSRTGEPFDYRMNTSLDGLPLDDDAFEKTLTGKQVDPIQWIEDQDDMLIGTLSASFKSGSMLDGEPTTPSNISFKRQSKKGSGALGAKMVDEVVLSVSRSGTRVRQIAYNENTYKYQSDDLTLLSGDITQAGIRDWDHAEEEDGVLWCVLNDGTLASCTYMNSQKVVAWNGHYLGGLGKAESVACIPGEEGKGDQVWLVVQRVVNGQVKRFIEVLEDPFKPRNSIGELRVDARAAFFVDSGLSYDSPMQVEEVTGDGSSLTFTVTGHGLADGDSIHIEKFGGEVVEIVDTTKKTEAIVRTRDHRVWVNDRTFEVESVTENTFVLTGEVVDNWEIGFELGEIRQRKDEISGLDHLEGEEVEVVGDGGYLGPATVVCGKIKLPRLCARVHAGFGYTSRYQPMRLEYPIQNGTIQTRQKRIMTATVRFQDTVSGRVGVGKIPTKWERILPQWTSIRSGQPVQLMNADRRVPLAGDTDTDGLFMVVQDKPLPMKIVCSVLEVDL